MNIWLMVLVSILPTVLKWVYDYFSKKTSLSANQQVKFTKCLGYMKKIVTESELAGLTPDNIDDNIHQQDLNEEVNT